MKVACVNIEASLTVGEPDKADAFWKEFVSLCRKYSRPPPGYCSEWFGEYFDFEGNREASNQRKLK